MITDVIFNAWGWGLLIGSLAGWSVLFARVGKIPPEMSVPCAACTAVLALFAGGLCGVLGPAALAFALAGLALLILSLVFWRGTWREFATPGFAFLAIFAVFIAWQVHDDHLSHNDDFNHWAVMVKNLLLRGAFPDKSVTAIDFSSYPPGSALFVYYVNEVTAYRGRGLREGLFIFGQNLMVICMLPTVFLPMRKRREGESRAVRACLWAMLSACAILIFLYEFRALVVDVLNGVIGFAAIAGVLTLRDDPKRAALYAAPLTAVGLLVKYSNMYYAAATLIALIWVSARAKKRGEKSGALWSVGAVAFCLAVVAAWFLHVRAAYPGVADTHSMNLGRILEVLRGWSGEDVRTIARVCLYLSTSLKKSSVLLTAFMNAALLGLAAVNFLAFRKSPKRILVAVALADLCYVGYQLMLFSAYLLSFPREEALTGASYGRYNMSVMIWVIGFLSAVAVDELRALGEAKRARAWRGVYALGFALVTVAALAVTGEGETLFREVPYEGTRQFWADRIVSQMEIEDGDRFFIVAADEDARQVSSVFHYKVNRRVEWAHVDSLADREALIAAAADCDWVVILEEDPRLEALVGPPGAYRADTLEPWADAAEDS